MKKVWKGAAAAIAALSLGATGFIGATSAYAVEGDNPGVVETTPATYSITIKNADEGHTFNAYQIFQGKLSENGATLSDVQWGNGVTEAGQTAAYEYFGLTGDNQTAAKVAEELAKATTDSDKAKGFAALFKTADNLNTVAGTANTRNEQGNYVINGLTAGYYLVKDTGIADGNNHANTVFIMKVVGNAQANVKSSKPTVSKEVKDEAADKDGASTDNDGWGDSADHEIGETFQFKLTASLPADSYRNDYATYKLVFNDTMSKGITYKGIQSVKVNTTTVNAFAEGTNPNGYKVAGVTDGDKGEKSWTLTIDDIKKILTDKTAINGEITVEVIYNAQLNGDAVSMDATGSIAQNNVVDLDYSNNPYGDGYGTTEEDKVYVATLKVNVNKVDGATQDALSGVKFTLHKNTSDSAAVKVVATADGYRLATEADEADEATTTTTELVTNAQGKLNLSGLDTGTYYLVETEPLDGYNQLAGPVKIEVTAEHTNDKVTSLNTANKPVVIENNKGSQLPETGGMGTTMLYVAGGAIVLIAGIGMAVALRRRQA